MKPNIVFVLIDDQGWVDLAGFNEHSSKFYRTPEIAKLAEESVRFTSAYAEPACAPTRADILTGLYPVRHQIYTVKYLKNKADFQLDRRENNGYLDPRFITFADILKKEGYKCGFLGKWHLGGANAPYGPTYRGFDINIGGSNAGSPPGKEGTIDGLHKEGGGQYWSDDKGAFPHLPNLEANGKPYHYLTDRLTDEAIDLMQSYKNEPFFVYLSHFGIHAPPQATAEDQAIYEGKAPDPKHPRHKDILHAGMITSISRSVGKIHDYLENTDDPRNKGHKLIDNTMLIYYSDNGSAYGRSDNFPLRQGKGHAYEGGVRVPLMVKWKGHRGESKSIVHAVDMFPTIVELATGKPSMSKTDGISLLPLINQEKETIDRAIYRHQPVHVGNGPSSSIHKGDYKLIYYYNSPGDVYEGHGHYEFYNLKDDIGESNNLAEKLDLSEPIESEALDPNFVELARGLNHWLRETKAALPYEKGTKKEVELPEI